jgi:hypothetical protein
VDGKRLFPDEVRAVWRHLPGLHPLVLSQLSFLGGVVDVWLVGIVRLSAKNPFGAPRYLENGHRACDCRNPWRPLSSLACLASPSMSHLDIEHHRASASFVEPMGSAPPSKVFGCGSWASVVSVPAGLVPPSEVVLQTTLVA